MILQELPTSRSVLLQVSLEKCFSGKVAFHEFHGAESQRPGVLVGKFSKGAPTFNAFGGAVSLGRELFGSFRADCSIRGVRSDWESIRR